MAEYPTSRREWDRWILDQRRSADVPGRTALDPQRPYAFILEEERSNSGEIVPVATIFLTNRECPWRCLMCDLWKNTLTVKVPEGAIPLQIDYALSKLGPAREVKLYNSGSFFDRGAVPVSDYKTIAERLASFDRIIVESHPLLVNDDCLRFSEMVDGRLEVAMGLETVHPEAAASLNKGMTLEQFSEASRLLRRHGIPLRVFILVQPPFVEITAAVYWSNRSVDFAFECSAETAILIPTRTGNGALEILQDRGDFAPPQLATLEAAAEYGIGLRKGRVFADLWDLEQFFTCDDCFPERQQRLHHMNLSQEILPPVACGGCVEYVA